MFTANMMGARLAYVVRELQGTVKREKCRLVLAKKGGGKMREWMVRIVRW